MFTTIQGTNLIFFTSSNVYLGLIWTHKTKSNMYLMLYKINIFNVTCKVIYLMLHIKVII